MYDFKENLNKSGEVGYVVAINHSLVYVDGLPGATLSEMTVFESGAIGMVFSVNRDNVEILLFSPAKIKVGEAVARTGEDLRVPVTEKLIGRLVDPVLRPIDGKGEIDGGTLMPIDNPPPIISKRVEITKPLETGVGIIDLVVPLGKGQRELVIGDRKTGKTEFLLQTIVTQAKKGTTCIYAIVGQKKVEIQRLAEFFEAQGILENTVIIAADSSTQPGLIFVTPYSAMTLAEHMVSKGKDVLVVLDDVTTHARVYREISLLARKFPGRGSYPGDIFYIHSRLFERSGNFKEGSISTLAVAESVLGDLSGYIQTNLMAMTDGHIFFDINLYNQGKRPAVNPFLSVTRVGHQTQTPLLISVSRELLSFLVTYERMKQFMHFGAEVGKTVKNILTLGARIDIFLDQKESITTPININVFILCAMWSGIWNETRLEDVTTVIGSIREKYNKDVDYKKAVDELISSHFNFSDLVNTIRRDKGLIAI